MPFLSTNQQHQSTEGIIMIIIMLDTYFGKNDKAGERKLMTADILSLCIIGKTLITSLYKLSVIQTVIHNNCTKQTVQSANHQRSYEWTYSSLYVQLDQWFLDPEGGSQKATLVVLVVISSLKIRKAFLIRSEAQRNFASIICSNAACIAVACCSTMHGAVPATAWCAVEHSDEYLSTGGAYRRHTVE